jgi:hypothetical protein
MRRRNMQYRGAIHVAVRIFLRHPIERVRLPPLKLQQSGLPINDVSRASRVHVSGATQGYNSSAVPAAAAAAADWLSSGASY